MQRLFFYFLSLFIIFFACTENTQYSTKDNVVVAEPPATTKRPNAIVSETPSNPEASSIKTHSVPNTSAPPATKMDESRIPQAVEQAGAKDLVYPPAFKDFDIPMYKKADITNNIMLENSKGKFGQRLMLDCPGSLQEVYNFYDGSLLKNGWERNKTMDKEQSDADYHYRSALYDKDGFSLSVSLMDVKQGIVKVNQILKQN